MSARAVRSLGPTALVTGAGSGLGFAMARGLAEAGALVVLNGRTAAKLDAAADASAQRRPAVETAVFDVADSAPSTAASATLLAPASAPIDILVNNAGIQHRTPIDDFTDADWRRVMATNLDAPFFMARALIPQMKARARAARSSTSAR